MKIAIAKSLLEPVGIPWFRIKADGAVTDIMAAIQQYLEYLKDKGWTNSYSDGTEAREQDLSFEARDTLMRSVRIRIADAGAMDVDTKSIKHHAEYGYTFLVFFKTRDGGPRHMKDFSIVKID